MGGANSWRINVDTEDWMRDVEKRILAEERRPTITSASDLLGPGFGPYAVETLDWSADETVFNGYFFSQPGALNSPDSTKYWIGTTEGVADGNGYEVIRAYDPLTGPAATHGHGTPHGTPRVTANAYLRFFFTPPGSGQRQYTAWVVDGGGGSGVSVTAGNGLTLTGSTLDVVAGDSSITVGADDIRVATNGITNAMIADGAINLATADVTGTLPLTKGGTGGTSAATARASLGAVGKFAGVVGALAAGVETLVTHSLGTQDVVASFRDATTNRVIEFEWRSASTTQIGVTADIAYAASAIRATVVG